MTIGYALTGSFCTVSQSLEQLALLAREHEIVPIVSENVSKTDTRFSSSADTVKRIVKICGREPIKSIAEAEPLGPARPLDALIIAPCTGNTLAKMSNGITDTSVTMAAKAHMRSDRTLIIALATNDALSQNLKNIGTMLTRKGVYFVPLEQDAPMAKPHSLVSDFSLIPQTLEYALSGKQIRPLFR